MRHEIDASDDKEKGRVIQQAASCIHGAGSSLRNFPGLLKQIIWARAWERWEAKGRVIELASLRELITEKPIRGWGEDPKKVEAVIKDDPEALAMFREAMKHQGGDRRSEQFEPKPNNVRDRSNEATAGNSRAYSIDRVKRECEPDVVAKVMSGEMSPNAALVRAGIRENRQVYIPREPAKAVEKLRSQFGEEFVIAMAEAVNAMSM